MEQSSNRALYFKVKYGSVKSAKLIILARRKKYHSIVYKNYLEWFYRTGPFFGLLSEYSYHKTAKKSWFALKLIEQLAK